MKSGHFQEALRTIVSFYHLPLALSWDQQWSVTQNEEDMELKHSQTVIEIQLELETKVGCTGEKKWRNKDFLRQTKIEEIYFQ